MHVQRLAAFSDAGVGGNPAGVVLCEALPEPDAMQALAAAVGYSEMVFAARVGDGWRVRYFSPAMEVPFCGHATIALGAVLALAHGDGAFALQLNGDRISVEGGCRDGVLHATLRSPPARSAPAGKEVVAAALDLFGLGAGELEAGIPPAVIEAGARHLLLALAHRGRLAKMAYDLESGRAFMEAHGFVTINLVHARAQGMIDARDAFAAGGVYEDPATGAAAAALGGYLREIGWWRSGALVISQGVDMGVPCRLHVRAPREGLGMEVSGEVRVIGGASGSERGIETG